MSALTRGENLHSTVNTSSLWGTVQRQMLKSKSVVKARG